MTCRCGTAADVDSREIGGEGPIVFETVIGNGHVCVACEDAFTCDDCCALAESVSPTYDRSFCLDCDARLALAAAR